MKVLVLNSGSSSIKYQLFGMTKQIVLASGAVERIGETRSLHTLRVRDADGKLQTTESSLPVPSHQEGLARIARATNESGALEDPSELFGIGHRVVHGGEFFQEPTLVNDETLARVREMIPLAPLHNPANLMGIEVSLKLSPKVPQVAVFDTAFHQTMPRHAYRYAIPESLYAEHRARRYGFHGTSHRYVAKQAADYLGRPLETLNLITLHLGNGASATAIRGGKSIDTSMGMTPLEGLVMGTRCGDLDPAIHFYLARETGKSFDEIEEILNRESGLKGVCGENDMREVLRLAETGNEHARLALDMYCYRLKKYIGAYYAVLGHVDAIIFTAGIGENNPSIRRRACAGLSELGIRIDEHKNDRREPRTFEFHDKESTVSLLVVPTDEELEIAHQTVACIRDQQV